MAGIFNPRLSKQEIHTYIWSCISICLSVYLLIYLIKNEYEILQAIKGLLCVVFLDLSFDRIHHGRAHAHI